MPTKKVKKLSNVELAQEAEKAAALATAQLPIPVTEVKPNEVTVIWSGGFDSTALILKYLEEGKTVRTIGVCLSNNEDQSTAEKAARLRIYHALAKEFTHEKIHRPNEFVWPTLTHNGFGLIQPPIWLYVAAVMSHTDDVAFGWVKHDDVWHYRQWIYGLMDNLDAFKRKKTNILIPFEWDLKEDLLKYYLKRKHIFDLISTSELGEDWRVGTDKKCKEMQDLLLTLSGMIADEEVAKKKLAENPDEKIVGQIEISDRPTKKLTKKTKKRKVLTT